MTVVAVTPRVRLIAAGSLGLALLTGAIAAGGGPAHVPSPRPGRVASLAPRGARGLLTGYQAIRAARVCAAHAAAAGWANNGTYGGNLVTATAVCVAESGGQPKVYHCDETGAIGFYPPVSCAKGTYDRGLWQLNSRYQAKVTDKCAFGAQCNANAAYRISYQGTSFSPWAVYESDFYTTYTADAQAAVSALTAGAVASGVFGACLARSAPGAGAAAVVGTCGRSTRAQQWTVRGGTLSHGGLCLAAGSGPGQPAVSLAACDGTASQAWAPYRPDQLRNRQTGECLDDPGASLQAGTELTLATCAPAREQAWWLP